MADINREAQEFAEIMAQVNFEMKAYGQLSASTAARRTDAEMKARFGLDDFTKATGLGADALIKLGGSAKAAGSAALEGSKKASSMNAAFDELTDAVKIAAVGLSLLIPGSRLMKGVYAGLAFLFTSAMDTANKIREVSVKFSDELYKGYSDQAQAGAAASDGMTGLFEDAKKLGYSLGELGEYTALIGANSKDLALFSGTVFEGRQKFADMGKSFEKYSGNLIAAGFTQVQINEGMMGYLKLQSRAGLSQGKTSEQLAEGARKYLLEMDGLSKITGQTRKEMEGQRERQLLNEQFAAKIRELQLKGTPEALAFAENLKQAGNIAARAGPQMEEAFLASVTGNFANEKAIGANIASGNALMANIQKMGQGLMTPVEAMQGTFQALGRFGDSMNGLAQVNQFEAAFGIKYSTVQEARLLGEGNLVKNLEKAEAERKKQGAEGGKAADDAVNAQVNFQVAMRKANEEVERFFVPGMVAATNGAAAFASSAEYAAKQIKKLFDIDIGKPAPAPISTGPETDTARKTVAAATEKAMADAERARAAEKDAALSKEQKEAIKKQAADSARIMMNETNALRAAAQKEKNAERERRRAGTAEPAAAGVKVSGSAEAKTSAEKYFGKPISDSEFSALIKATHAEAAGGKQSNQQEQAMIMASVLNRARTNQGGIMGALQAKNAFQSVTGTEDAPGPSQHYEKGPEADRLKSIEGATKLLEKISVEQKNFTAADAKAYGPGTDIGYRDKMLAAGGTVVGGSVFQTLPKFQGGGIANGPTSGYPVELHGKEAVIPLKNDAVPVSISLKDALNTPTFAGMNEYAGYNQGPMSTDIDAVKKLAEAVGAFDKTSQIITDTATWKQILSSGLATNYKLVNAELGTKALPGIDQDMADRLKEIKEQGNTTTEAALKQVGEELIKGMSSMAEKFAVTMTSRALSVDSSEIAPLLQELVSATKNGNDINTKILASSY